MSYNKPIYINGIKTMYSVNSDGYVFNHTTGKRMRPSKNHKGYEMVVLYDSNVKPRTYTVHRLVATAFVENPDNKPIINHIDGDKTNNHYTNLEWVTSKENTIHAWKTGLCKPVRGTKNGNNKYTEYQIRQVCELLEHKEPLRKIHKITGVSKDSIYRIAYAQQWRIIRDEYDIDTEFYKTAYINTDVTQKHRKDAEKIIRTGVCDSPKRICEMLHIEYNNPNRKVIQAIKKKVLDEGSTTIENSEYYVIDIH